MHPKLYPCSLLLNQSTISSGQQLGSHHLTDSSHLLSIPINHYFISILYPQYPSNSSTFLHLHYHHPNKSSSSLAYVTASASCLRSPGSLLPPSNPFFTDDVCQIRRVNHVTPQIEILQRFLITFRLKGENYTTYNDIRGDFSAFLLFQPHCQSFLNSLCSRQRALLSVPLISCSLYLRVPNNIFPLLLIFFPSSLLLHMRVVIIFQKSDSTPLFQVSPSCPKISDALKSLICFLHLILLYLISDNLV